MIIPKIRKCFILRFENIILIYEMTTPKLKSITKAGQYKNKITIKTGNLFYGFLCFRQEKISRKNCFPLIENRFAIAGKRHRSFHSLFFVLNVQFTILTCLFWSNQFRTEIVPVSRICMKKHLILDNSSFESTLEIHTK